MDNILGRHGYHRNTRVGHGFRRKFASSVTGSYQQAAKVGSESPLVHAVQDHHGILCTVPALPPLRTASMWSLFPTQPSTRLFPRVV
jgi:hypothetical protein